MKTILATLVFAIALAGCNAVEGMRDMKDTEVQLTELIKEEIGVESIVAFTINDGVLIDVSISLSGKEVADRSVSELTRAAQAAVQKSFEDKPRVIYIEIVTAAK